MALSLSWKLLVGFYGMAIVMKTWKQQAKSEQKNGCAGNGKEKRFFEGKNSFELELRITCQHLQGGNSDEDLEAINS